MCKRSQIMALTVTAILIFCAVVTSYAQLDYSAWNYSFDVDIDAGAIQRSDVPIELQVNFTGRLPLGKMLNPDSIRVVEYGDADRSAFLSEKTSQFDPGNGYDATTNAAGEVVWILDGITFVGQTRYFKVYFDTTENASIAAPNYSSSLEVLTSGDIVTEVRNNQYNPGYGYDIKFSNRGSIYKCWNGLTNKWAWDLGGTDTTQSQGLCYYISNLGDGWAYSFQGTLAGEGTAKRTLNRQGPVRAIVTTERIAQSGAGVQGMYRWKVTYKFYPHNIPYWVTKISLDKTPENYKASGRSSTKNVLWMQRAANSRPNIYPASVTDYSETPFKAIFDWSPVEGGVGMVPLLGHDPNQTKKYTSSLYGWVTSETYENEMWKYQHVSYPFDMSHAFVMHNGLNEADAQIAMQKVYDDLQSPVNVVIKDRGTVTGIVTDGANVIKDAVVRIYSGSYSKATVTTSEGKYSFVGVPAGTYYFSVKKRDYIPNQTSSLAVTAGINTRDVTLSALPAIDLTTQIWALGIDETGYVFPFGTGPVTPTSDFSAPGADETGFQSVTVGYANGQAGTPNWETLQMNEQSLNNVYGWYRVKVNVPNDSDWNGKNLVLKNFVVKKGAAEIYFNGVKVGESGKFPTTPRDPSTGVMDTTPFPIVCNIPAGIVNFGGNNVIAIRIFDSTSTDGGLYYAAPILQVADTLTASVSGTVTDAQGPVAGARVVLGGAGETVTDANGNYSITGVMGNIYEITAEKAGPPSYIKTYDTVDVPDTGSVTKNLYLTRIPTVCGQITRMGDPHPCRVILDGPAGFYNVYATNGSFKFENINLGTYKLYIHGYMMAPKIVDNIVISEETWSIHNYDLPYASLPVYDDFNGATLDTNKWTPANEFLGQYSDGVIDDPLQVANTSFADGIMTLTPAPPTSGGRTGFRSTQSFVGETMAFGLKWQSWNKRTYFTIQDGDNFLDNNSIITVPDVNRIQIVSYLENDKEISRGYYLNNSWPATVVFLKTGNWIDFYVNGIYRTTANANIGSSPFMWDTLTDPIKINLLSLNTGTEGAIVSYWDEVYAGVPVPFDNLTICDTRNRPSGSQVYLTEAVVSASFSDAFWVQTADRSSGIKVISTAKPAVGSKITVLGQTIRVYNEVAVQAMSIKIAEAVDAPIPVGITGKTAAEFDKAGAAAQGMLVKVAGKVTGVHRNDELQIDGYFLDDGSGLAGDGTHKGLCVIVDPKWGTQESIVGTFKTVIGPLTVAEMGTGIVPAVRSVTFDEPATYTAYNDCGWSLGQTDQNITFYGIGTGYPTTEGYATSGYLKNYSTGALVPVTVTFTQSGTVGWTGTDGMDVTTGDAYDAFGGKVNLTGYIKGGASGWYVDITISGANPGGRYEFTTTTNLTGGSMMEYTAFTISGARSFTNTSSAGTGVIITPDGASTSFDSGMNLFYGYVAKWTNIQPDETGTFKIRVNAGEGSITSCGPSAFILKRLQ